MAVVSTRPNSPARHAPRDNVRRLRRKLWLAAKASPDRRFHALYDRILRGDVLEEAWRRVRVNRGAAGTDQQTIAAVEAYGVSRMLAEIAEALQTKTYRPAPVLRRYIPKPGGRRRPLGIPTVKDRVVQQAVKLVVEPVFEADFLPVSYGFRPRRSATQACEVLRKAYPRGYRYAVEMDIVDCFGRIDRDRLMALVGARISDRRVLKLIRGFLRAGVMEEGRVRRETTGTPQGGVISPLLANVYLHVFDAAFTARHRGILVRYADDAVILCRTRAEAEQALALAGEILRSLGLELHPDKTRVVDLTEGREGFDFLGWHFHARVSGRLLERGVRRYYLHRWPSTRAMNAVRATVRALTGRNRAGVDLRVVIRDLNPVLRGWGNYFRTGNAAKKFNRVDSYVWRRLSGLMRTRYGRHVTPQRMARWTSDRFVELGLHRLRGTVRYPEVSLL